MMGIRAKMVNQLSKYKLWPVLLFMPLIGSGIGYVVVDRDINSGKHIIAYDYYSQYRGNQLGIGFYNVTVNPVLLENKELGYKVEVSGTKNNDNSQLKTLSAYGTEVVNRSEIKQVLLQSGEVRGVDLKKWASFALVNNKLAQEWVKRSQNNEVDIDMKLKMSNESGENVYSLTYVLIENNYGYEYPFVFTEKQIEKSGLKYIL